MQMHMSFLKVDDILVDVNNTDSTIKGYGIGKIEKINEEFFYVRFPTKKLLVIYNQFLFRHDTAGLKGSRRAYTLKEFLKNWNCKYFDESYLDKNLLEEVLKYNK